MSVSLTTARRNLGYALSQLEVHTSGVLAPGDTDYTGTTDHAYKRRVIVSTDIVSMGPTATETDDDTDMYTGAFVYVPSLPQQRRVSQTDGYLANEEAAEWTDLVSPGDGDERVGVLFLAQQFATALDPNVEFEIHHGAMPPLPADGKRGLHAMLNLALSTMWLPDAHTVSVIATAGKTRYDLSAYPWIKEEKQLLQINRPNTNTQIEADRSIYGGSIVVRGGTRYLRVNNPPNTGEVFTIDVKRRANTLIMQGGAWADSTVGFVKEDDEADVDEETLTIVALYRTYLALEQSETDEKARANYHNLRTDAEMRAQVAMRTDPIIGHDDDGSQAQMAMVSSRNVRSRRSWP